MIGDIKYDMISEESMTRLAGHIITGRVLTSAQVPARLHPKVWKVLDMLPPQDKEYLRRHAGLIFEFIDRRMADEYNIEEFPAFLFGLHYVHKLQMPQLMRALKSRVLPIDLRIVEFPEGSE